MSFVHVRDSDYFLHVWEFVRFKTVNRYVVTVLRSETFNDKFSWQIIKLFIFSLYIMHILTNIICLYIIINFKAQGLFMLSILLTVFLGFPISPSL